MMSQRPDSLFRQEALEYHASGIHRMGEVLRLYPNWTRWTYWLLLFVVEGALLYLVLEKVSQYAEGPAVIWIDRTFVTAKVPGSVRSIGGVGVQTGDYVDPNTALVYFHDAQELAELRRIQRAFELQLVNTLRDPRDQPACQALTDLRARRDQAQALLEERCVRAPCAGYVGDIRIRDGEHFSAGDVLLSLAPHDPQDPSASGPEAIAMLPAQYLPLLRKEMDVRLELAGHRHVYAKAKIKSVEQEAIGPAEVRRYLGQPIADAVSVQGPAVLVRARLDHPQFEVDDKTCRYSHGMQARASVCVRSECLALTLLPALRAVIGEGREAAVAVLGIAAFTLVLCAWPGLASARRSLARHLRHRPIPFVPQAGSSDGAAACLAMVLGYHGRQVRLAEVGQHVAPGHDGPADHIEAVQPWQLIGKAVRVAGPRDLRDVPPASILGLTSGLVVFERATRQEVRVLDPARGQQRIPIDQFENFFTGAVLTFEPQQAYASGASPGSA